MTEDAGWIRDKLFGYAAEISAQRTRQDATEASVQRIASEMDRGFSDQRRMLSEGMQNVQTSISRELTHLRGEISQLENIYQEQRRIDDEREAKRAAEEKRRTDELINELRLNADRSESAADKASQVSRRVIFAMAVLVACASAFIEHVPSLLNFIGNLVDAANIAG